jgi:hypothetical protein
MFMLIYLRLKSQPHYTRHAQVKLVQGILWVKVLQNLEKDHQRHLHLSTTDTQVNVPCQQRIPWALPNTSNQSLLHTINQHECTALEGFL